MTDSMELRRLIKRSGMKIAAILEALGMKNYTTLREKIDNKREFKVSEVEGLCALLNIDQEGRQRIFFKKDAERHSA